MNIKYIFIKFTFNHRCFLYIQLFLRGKQNNESIISKNRIKKRKNKE